MKLWPTIKVWALCSLFSCLRGMYIPFHIFLIFCLLIFRLFLSYLCEGQSATEKGRDRDLLSSGLSPHSKWQQWLGMGQAEARNLELYLEFFLILSLFLLVILWRWQTWFLLFLVQPYLCMELLPMWVPCVSSLWLLCSLCTSIFLDCVYSFTSC